VFFCKKKKYNEKEIKIIAAKNMKVYNLSFDKFTCRKNARVVAKRRGAQEIPRLIRRRTAIFALMRVQFFFIASFFSQ